MKIGQIPGLVELKDFDEAKRTDKKALYFLCDGLEVVYVGKTKNLPERIKSHRNKKFTRLFFLPPSVDRLDASEGEYIDYFKPKYNVRLEKMEILVSLNVRLRPMIRAMLDVTCLETGRSVRAIVEEAIERRCAKSKLKSVKKGQP